MKLRIGYEFPQSASTLDPARIEDIYQSNLIENIFSRIIEYDIDGSLTCVLCEKFWIENNSIFFEFKNNLKTKDGYNITAEDAVFSLKRLILLQTNTHGNLSHFININDKDSIKVSNNTLEIKLISSHYSQFLLPLLASMDFSIIPERSVVTKDNVSYLDLKNTSGPYYLKKDSDDGFLELEANVNHPFYDEKMAKEISVIPVKYGEGIDAFLSNKIDVLDITYYPGFPQYEKLFNQNKKFTYHKTTLINVFMLNFSSDSSKDFSNEELFYAANIISEKCLSFKKYGYGFKEVVEFFQSNGSGHLNNDQMEKIVKLRKQEKIKFRRPLILGVYEDSFERYKEAFKDHPEILIKSYPKNPAGYPLSERPDVFFQTTDSSFNEDISLLSYNFSMEYFGTSKENGEKWIANFIKEPIKENRIKLLQEFQLELLERPILYPMGASPYWSIANEDLELNFSETFPGSAWWKIRKK